MPYIHKTQYHNGIHTQFCVIDIETLGDYPIWVSPPMHTMYIICARCKEIDCPVDSRRVLPYIDGENLQCPLVMCDACYRQFMRDKQIRICLK